MYIVLLYFLLRCMYMTPNRMIKILQKQFISVQDNEYLLQFNVVNNYK